MPRHADALTASVMAMSQFYVGDATLEGTLRRVADLATETIAGADSVGVVMLVDGRPRTTVFTDVTALEIDDAQYESGIGPSLVALRSQQVQRIDWIDRDRTWPPFRQAAMSKGILSSLSVPLIAHGESIGALNCYSRSGAAFSNGDEIIGHEFAAAAAIALANAQAYWDARHLSERIGFAMQWEATIEQAKGILIAEHQCGPDQALAILVRASQRENGE